MKSTFTLLACGLIFSASAITASAADEVGFKSIFNGKDLSGWWGNPKLWSVEAGAITGKTGDQPDNQIKHNTFLVYTNDSVDDFELRFKYKIVANNTVGFGNSGVQYRSRVLSVGDFGPIVGGYQADFEAGDTYSGILYEERGRGILAQRGQVTKIVSESEHPDQPNTDSPSNPDKFKVEVIGSVGDTKDIQANIKKNDWNDYIVIAKGNQLTHIINGRVTVSVIDEDAVNRRKSGVLALQIHVGQPMTVQFKDVRIRPIK